MRFSPLAVLRQKIQDPGLQKDGSTEQLILKGERTLPTRGVMMQEGGLKAIGGVAELSDLSVVWDDGKTVVGKSGWTDESSVLDASTIGTVYLADPDKLSLMAKRKHIASVSYRVLHFINVI